MCSETENKTNTHAKVNGGCEMYEGTRSQYKNVLFKMCCKGCRVKSSLP